MKRLYAEKNKILLVNITRLGDMLQATPTITGMKMENPNCHIAVLVEKQFESICHWLPDIDEVLTIDMGWIVRSIAAGPEGTIEAYDFVSEFIDGLKAKNFDYCLNMSSSSYTALLLKMLDIKRHGGWKADEEGHRVIESDWAKLFASSVFHQNRRYNSINLVDSFRCSADVEQHPKKLQIKIGDEELEYCKKLLDDAGFTNTGPLVAVQAGASQGKRQWAPARFAEMIRILVKENNMRVVLTGTKKELSIIDPIKEAVNSENVLVAAGKTNIPQLAALLKLSDILVTGDTGTMHISVATGTPVVSMFLASAFGFETGPYSEGNILLQPVVKCCPCNPNKPCSRPDCHDCIEPSMIADLVKRRLKEDFKSLPEGYADPKKVIIYRSYFDEFDFLDFAPLTSEESDICHDIRPSYRKLWLNELAGFEIQVPANEAPIKGVPELKAMASKGIKLIDELVRLIKDPKSKGAELGRVNREITNLDREIEELGFFYSYLGPVVRMYIFAKENISGTDPLSLASQSRENYEALLRRTGKLAAFYSEK